MFNPSYNKDKFENTSLTVDGKIGDLKLVYAGGYLVRNIEQQQDYTNYARGVYGYYYQCAGYSKQSGRRGKCYSPSSDLAGDREEHPPEPRVSREHAGRLADPRHRRLVLGRIQDLR